jgi:hypothetical protein
VHNVPGLPGAAELTAFAADLTHRFSYEASGTLSGGYYRNRARSGELSALAIDERIYRVKPALRYQPSPNLALDLSYEFDWGRHGDGSHATCNKVLLSLSVQRPLFD